MRFLSLIIFFFCNGVLAAVSYQPEQTEDVVTFISEFEIHPEKSAATELDLLRQISLKNHSSGEDRQHIWNRVQPCEGCHSYQMYTGNGYLPILQGQNLQYLFSKLQMFKTNRRSYHPLGRYFETLSSQDLMDISYFYAEQQSDLKRSLVVADLPWPAETRNMISIKQCSECHGVEGNGGRFIPAISGQNKNYLSYRIREIADDHSRVHLVSDAPVSCKIDEMTVRQSWALANLLSVVIDRHSVAQGAEVYRLKCAQCHEVDAGDGQSPAQAIDWSRHLQQGTRLLVYNTQFAHKYKVVDKDRISFSLNEIKHAIHYMINQLQSSL